MTKTILLAAVAALLSAPQDTPFNGKDFGGWKFKGGEAKSKWKVGKASLDPADPHKVVVAPEGNEMVNAEGHSCDISTEAKWGDALIEVEVLVAKGQNSGVYVMGEYEIQVLDSFGKEKVGAGDMGGLYAAAAPKVNASKAPGEWQKFVIDFRAPKFDADGKKTGNAKFVKIELNGQVIHENVEMKGPTPGGLTGKEAATGPIMYQGDHGIVSYRNLKVTPVK
jgi:3-keto-disaccharide hydrolase